MNLEELTVSQLRALRPQLGDAGRDRVDALLRAKGEIVPVEASIDVIARRQLRNAGVNVKKSEEDVRREIKGWALARGALAALDYEQGYRPDACKHCGGKLSHSTRVPLGTPDVLIFWPQPICQMWWVECKSSTGKQSEHQLKFEAYVRAAGGIYVLARSIDDCEAALARLAA